MSQPSDHPPSATEPGWNPEGQGWSSTGGPPASEHTAGPGWQPSPPSRQAPPESRPALWLAGIFLLAVVFLAGLAIGQSGALGGRDTAVMPSPAPATLPPASPSGGSPATPGTPAPADQTPAPGTTPEQPVITPVPIITPGPRATPPDQPAEAPESFSLFWEALEIIRQNFVGRDELEDRELTYGAIRGLVDALGDTGHSVFLTPEALARERESLAGTIVGVGALLGERAGRPIVVSVISGGPAQRAGLRSGDAFVTVDGVDVQQMTPEEIATRVRGEEGSTVELVVDRLATGERLTFNIVREEIRIPSTSWAMVPGTDIALLRLIQFSDGAADQLGAARDEALAAGAQSFILDLRSNPGGFVHEAVRVASLFIDDRTVYIRELADGQRIPVQTEEGLAAADQPMVVLIDEGTASSAEIVSGALRSAGRAELIGETTFGTGTVLLTWELSDGSAVRIAIERWLTPDGELIFGQGIEPTIEVAMSVSDAPMEPDELRDLGPPDVTQIADAQLRRAIELLGGPPAPSGAQPGGLSSGR